jgi:hypothetical protein
MTINYVGGGRGTGFPWIGLYGECRILGNTVITGTTTITGATNIIDDGAGVTMFRVGDRDGGDVMTINYDGRGSQTVLTGTTTIIGNLTASGNVGGGAEENLAVFNGTGDTSVKIVGNGEVYLDIENTNPTSGTTPDNKVWGIGTNDDNKLHFNYHTPGSMNLGNTMTMTSSGNVGIGETSPGEKLEVAGSVLARGIGAAGHGAVIYADGWNYGIFSSKINGASGMACGEETYLKGTDIHFQTGSSNTRDIQMTIKSTGNVGIGETSPTHKLHVHGTVKLNGNTVISSTTESTSISSGALQVSGGVGIAGSLNVGDNANINDLIIGTVFSSSETFSV